MAQWSFVGDRNKQREEKMEIKTRAWDYDNAFSVMFLFGETSKDSVTLIISKEDDIKTVAGLLRTVADRLDNRCKGMIVSKKAWRFHEYLRNGGEKEIEMSKM